MDFQHMRYGYIYSQGEHLDDEKYRYMYRVTHHGEPICDLLQRHADGGWDLRRHRDGKIVKGYKDFGSAKFGVEGMWDWR